MTGDEDSVESLFKHATHDKLWPDALSKIASLFSRTNDKSVRKLLAGIVLKESYRDDMRLAAYCALFEVSGRDLWALPPVREFRIPGDLDLQFLYECLA